MNEREVRLLWEVATTGSVTRAAERVHMTQPSASAAIRSIEERLGFALFTREKRRLELTPKGRSMLPEVANALAALTSLDRLANELRVDAGSRITIGSIAQAATTLLPFAIHALSASMPQARIVVRTALSVDVAGMVADRRVDFGLVVEDTLPPGAGMADIAALRLYVVMQPDAPLGSLASVPVELLSSHPYIALGRQLPIGALTARKFEEAGLAFSPAVEVMQFSSACAFVEAGYGVAILDGLSVALARQHGLLAIPLDVPDRLALRLVWPKGSALAKHAELFREALHQAMRAC